MWQHETMETFLIETESHGTINLAQVCLLKLKGTNLEFATYGRGAFSAKPIAGTGSTDIDRTNVPDVRRDGTRVNNNRRGR